MGGEIGALGWALGVGEAAVGGVLFATGVGGETWGVGRAEAAGRKGRRRGTARFADCCFN